MSQYVTIPSPLTTANLTTLNTSQAAINTILEAAKVPLTPDQEGALIGVSIKRDSEIDDVNNIFVKNNASLVPKQVNIAIFQQNIATVTTLKQLHAMQLAAADATETIIKAIQHNQILDKRLIISNIEVVAKNDSGAAQQLKDYKEKHNHKKASTSEATEMDIAESGTIKVAKVLTGKPFVNEGTVILTVAKEGGTASEVLKVNPAGSVKIPKGWTIIVVTNLSKTDPGKFSVFLEH